MKLLSRLALLLTLVCPAALVQAADDAFQKRMEEVKAAITAKRSEGKEAFFGELEIQAEKLHKDFPDEAEPYQMLLAVAQNSEPEKAREIFKKLEADGVPDNVKAQAQAATKKLDALGKPLDIKFTSVDGKEIDLTAMKGKVVLVDFWATWCGPCVAEVPNVVATYKKLHDKGFEIVGISFDKDKSALENFVKEKEMTWPQYFDGLFWQNKIGQEWGINSIPSMWLIDKEGNLADMNARGGLEAKVEALLAK